MKKYIAIDHENSKYYKDVPYITKREFKEKDNPVILGKTRLKEYESDSDEDIDLLCFNDEQYEVKEKILGFKKGYVDVGDNNYILLKKRIPFLLLLFLLLLLLLFLFFLFKPSDKVEEEPIKTPPPIQEEIKEPEKIPEDIPKEEPQPPKKEITKKPKPEITIPEEPKVITYVIDFDANGGEGTMDSVICEKDKDCELPDSVFTKDGYTFIGWSKDPNGDLEYDDKENVLNLSEEQDSKVILYAMWNINSYKITFLDYDNSLIEEKEYDYGETIVEPEKPTRKGYSFEKWDCEIDSAKEDLVVKATYKINTYDITYDLKGGNLDDIPSNYNVEDESFKISKPEKVGYTFIGWTTENNNEPIIDYEIPKGTIGNISLVANYEANTYNLKFNTNGAKEKVSSKKIKYDSEFGELPIVTKDGYTFINWVDKNNQEVSSKTIFNEANDITISANWKTISYNIIYNLVGGNIKNNPTSYNVESETITLPNPTKEGYIFIGWSTPDDNNTFIKDYKISKGTIGDIELIANYKPISYYISYDPQGAEGTMENTKVKYNNKTNLSKNRYDKEGYIFQGWSTVPNGDVVYNDESEIYNLSKENDAIITLYAKWQIIKLKVKYVDMFGGVIKEETVDYGSTPNYPADPFIDGYTFTGWSGTNDAIKSDITFRAKYSIDYYDVKYDLNTGQENDITTIRYNVETATFSLPNPRRTGYTFRGWTGANGLSPQKDVTIVKGTKGNKNYKANWVANIYNVALNPNKGTVNPSSISVSYNSLYGIIPEPERLGYTFEGWYNDSEKILETTVMNKDSDHELKADWKVINYDIIYDLKGGNLSSPITTYNIESENITLPTPTRTGYTFIGWTGSNGSTPSKNVVIPKGSVGNKNYVTNWEVINYSISYNLDGGSASSLLTQYNIETPSFTLPNPTKTGHTFEGWTGTGLSSANKNVTIAKATGNRSYTATWSKNSYTVNYYKDGSLWTTRSVKYGEPVPNLTPTGYDDYHKFGGWSGWVDNIPANDITLTAITSEAYCMLQTGTASKANAEGLQAIFTDVGYRSWLYSNDLGWGALTDYSLSRRQVDGLREIFANRVPWANATPYLNWLLIQCDNGHGESWKRYSNGNTWVILESW